MSQACKVACACCCHAPEKIKTRLTLPPVVHLIKIGFADQRKPRQENRITSRADLLLAGAAGRGRPTSLDDWMKNHSFPAEFNLQ